MSRVEHSWMPRADCTEDCLRPGSARAGRRIAGTIRATRRITVAVLILMAVPVLAIPGPGHLYIKRIYCRAMLRSLGLRITLSGGPVRNLRGMLIVSNHVSWTDVFAVGAVLPGSFVARADLINWRGVGLAARIVGIIPIERESLRQLPDVVDSVARHLRDGETVVAFPEGTTYCGTDHGPFRPALFQSAIDAVRPVQPLRLTYHHSDGTPSTVTAFLGDDSLWVSLKRIARVRRTIVNVEVRQLQLPDATRGELAGRCHAAVHQGTGSASAAAESPVGR